MNRTKRSYLKSLKYFVFLLFSLAIKNSIACSFKHLTEDELFDATSRIFRAKIISTELNVEKIGDQEFEIILAKYRLLESFKGSNPEEGIVKSYLYGIGNCSISILTGAEYVIYLEKNNFISLPSGSWWYLGLEQGGVTPKLNALRDRARKRTKD